MLGLLIVPIGITLAVVNLAQKGTAPMGDSCGQNDDCTKGLHCAQIKGKKQCTHACFPDRKDGEYSCAAGFACTSLTMRVGTKEVPTNMCTAP